MSKVLDDFTERRINASHAYVRGSADLLLEMSTRRDPAILYNPRGVAIIGAREVNITNTVNAKRFADARSDFIVFHEIGEAGDAVYWSGIQFADVLMAETGEWVKTHLLVTEMARREDDELKIWLRHASPLAAS